MSVSTISSEEVLKVLHRARRRLGGRLSQYDFERWSACTCGHIYAAATGGVGKTNDVRGCLDGGNGYYDRVIQGVALALGWEPGNTTMRTYSASSYVSACTRDVGRDRSAAIQVIDRAIKCIVEQCIVEQQRVDLWGLEGSWALEDLVDNAGVEVEETELVATP